MPTNIFADGFWADGLFADGFWAGTSSENTLNALSFVVSFNELGCRVNFVAPVRSVCMGGALGNSARVGVKGAQAVGIGEELSGSAAIGNKGGKSACMGERAGIGVTFND